MSRLGYEISIDSSRNIVHVIVKGLIQNPEGQNIIVQARELAAEHGINILYDVREASIQVSLTDIFYLPRTLSIFKNDKARLIKAAVWTSDENNHKSYQFYETVTRNLGLNIRIFQNEEEALRWIT